MSTQQLRAATSAAKEPKTFLELVDVMKPEIARALPRHLNAERMCRIATTEFRKNPKLGDCAIRTVFGAIITLSQLGLEPGVMGQAWLVPYGKDCQAIPGWQGYVDLVSRGGRACVWTGAVFRGDHFDWALGDRPFVSHKPSESEELPTPDRLTHCYAIGRVKGAEWPVVEVWSVPKIKAHRDRFNKVGAKHYSYQHFEMYGRKVPLLQVIKYMPKSVELQMAMDLENAAETGRTIDMTEAGAGTWTPPVDPETSGAGSPDSSASIAEIRTATSLEQLGAIYNRIVEAYVSANIGVPVEVEGAFGDRKTSLEQKS